MRAECRDVLTRMIERFRYENDRRARIIDAARNAMRRPTRNPSLWCCRCFFSALLWHGSYQSAAEAHVATRPRGLDGDRFIARKGLGRDVIRYGHGCRERPSHEQKSGKVHDGQPDK